MNHGRLRWPSLAALVTLLTIAFSATAIADTLTPDGDTVAPGNQATVNLGTVTPGATLSRSASFLLECASNKHVDLGQTVVLAYSSGNSTVPSGGSATIGGTSIGPVQAAWPDDQTGSGTNCASTPQVLQDNGDASVSLTAPTANGSYSFLIKWSVDLTPAGNSDSSSISGNFVQITYNLTVQGTTVVDTDGDGVADAVDNCPAVANADQADTDGDGLGNLCDPTPNGDTDGDGIDNASDNCPTVANADQADTDGDGVGNACDTTPSGDSDGDGVDNANDNCPTVANADQADVDNDGVGDACDDNSYAPQLGTAASDDNGDEGETLTTNGSFTDQDGNDTLTISKSGSGTVIDNGDGTWSWSFATTDDGSGQVTVKASDGEHTDATDTFSWSAANVAPTGTFHTPSASVAEGSGFNLSISDVTDPSSADASAGFTYAFDCGNGYGSFGSSSSVSCTTATDGPATLSVAGKVRDKDGGVSEYTGSVTVDNVDPSSLTASFGSSGVNCVAGSANATLGFGFADPGADTWDAQIDWDYDGTFSADQTKQGVSKSDSATHAYGTSGSHTAAIKIVDDDGGSSGVQTATVWVNYNLGNILQPVNDTGHGQSPSVFKYGSTIPVKVEVTDCAGTAHPSNLVLKVTWRVGASTTPVGVDEVVPTSQADLGNTMRFSDPLYVLQLDSKKTTSDSSSAVTLFVSIMNGSTAQQTTTAYIGFKK